MKNLSLLVCLFCITFLFGCDAELVLENEKEVISEESAFEENDLALELVDENNLEKVVQFPVDGFQEKILLKPFGLYVTPSNSPVSPERFQGFHVGVDVEFDDAEETLVYAIADGEVILRRNVNGYGGVLIIKHEMDGEVYSVLYGHLDLDSLVSNQFVQKGEVVGVLGEGYTEQTDGERKHLHFGIKRGYDLDVRGYVQSENDLSEWVDPVEFYAEYNNLLK